MPYSTMPTRRQFVSASSVALTGTAFGLRSSPDVHRLASESALPPAIRALTPLTDEVTPISVDERRARIEKAKRLMRDLKIDALVLTGGTSMEYFTGIKWGVSERLLATVIPVRGSAFLVTPKFEEGRAMEQAHAGPLGSDAQVYAWEEDENPHALIAQGFRERGQIGRAHV